MYIYIYYTHTHTHTDFHISKHIYSARARMLQFRALALSF